MLHQVRAKLQPAQVAYLEKEVLPPLSLSIEQLLREIQNFVDTDGKIAGVPHTSGDRLLVERPLTWLAQSLMRNHPKYAALNIKEAEKLRKSESDKKGHAATMIQKTYRGYKGRKTAKARRAEAKAIEQQRLAIQHQAAIEIQRFVRGFLARKLVQRIKNAPPPSPRKVAAATKIQAVWRGYHTRKVIKQMDPELFM